MSPQIIQPPQDETECVEFVRDLFDNNVVQYSGLYLGLQVLPHGTPQQAPVGVCDMHKANMYYQAEPDALYIRCMSFRDPHRYKVGDTAP